ncbi:TetR/AcrR family transcriptional regulator [Saccharothrix sp.]|uniref:TetR/AcrR family transcriptional regulator n=1 Tax=Saccharothrix sp. TaxID=1873460 RepID=UPI002810F849|nr:TetR/AcrR family transcriptional regulator [Saccharothrix sp.]
MARPKNFDEERALDAAMRAFWVNGYHATSTQDLCEATGLGRSSIYNTFTSKHELFTRALSRYAEAMSARQLQILEDSGRSPLGRIRALLELVLAGEEENRRGGRGIGCLTVNTVVELGDTDPEAARVIDRDHDRRIAALRAVIEQGQRDGEIRTSRDAEQFARFLNSVVAGIRVAGQGGADREVLEGIAVTALDALIV